MVFLLRFEVESISLLTLSRLERAKRLKKILFNIPSDTMLFPVRRWWYDCRWFNQMSWQSWAVSKYIFGRIFLKKNTCSFLPLTQQCDANATWTASVETLCVKGYLHVTLFLRWWWLFRDKPESPWQLGKGYQRCDYRRHPRFHDKNSMTSLHTLRRSHIFCTT